MKKLSCRTRIIAIIMVFCMVGLLTACSNTSATNQEITEYLNREGYTYTFSSVSTPKNSSVQTMKYSSSNWTSARTQEINEYVEDEIISEYNWTAVKKSEPASYNCHSYAWYSQSTSNSHWINQFKTNTSTGEYTNTANLSKYWTDGSYSLITSVSNGSIPSSVANGSKVFYVNGDHSAIKYSNTKFRSKWGAAGVYEHSPSQAPYVDVSNLKYYKKN